MVGVRLPTHNTLKTNKMVQEKQLKELFKYIEANWDVCVSQVDKTDIKRIFGGVLCEDIMNETEPAEQPEQPSSKGKLDNSFDKERFERMFFASIGIGKFANFSDIILWVETTLQQLDAYYASKEGGNNE